MITPNKDDTERQVRRTLKKELNCQEGWPNGDSKNKGADEMGFELDEGRSAGHRGSRAEPPHTGRTDSTTNTQ